MPMSDPTIYLIDDNEAFLDLFATLPEAAPFNVKTFKSPQKALAAFCRKPPDLVVSDVQMPEMSGIELFHQFQDLAPFVPVILVTAFSTTEQAVAAVQNGAYHYFEKPLSDKWPLFWTTVREAVAKSQMQRQLAIFNTQSDRKAAPEPNLIGCSAAMAEVLSSIELVAELPATVLVTGETGTGKELVARLIHQKSGRKTEAFFAINCNEFAPGILESELFGHERGSFTGATHQRRGYFEMADNGTIFLDEIGDAPGGLQSKLLRVLETRQFTRVGSSDPNESNFRLIAATNQDLSRAIAENRFRSDLLYRINTFEIEMPPLRQRKEDIPLLADYYLAHFNQDYRRTIEGLSEAALLAMRNYNWPGNVRELINVIERAVIICQEPVITTRHLPFENDRDQEELSTLHLTEMEKFYIQMALKRTSGNKSHASELLGISRKTLIDKVKKY